MAADKNFNFHSVQIHFDQSLGSGAYGSVYKATCDHLPCAAKVLHPMFFNSSDPAVRQTIVRFKSECKLLSSLQHPNIVQFLGEFSNSSGQTALVMELMDESLTNFLIRYDPLSDPVPTHLSIDISHDISLALHYLHNNGIIHRDLTSNNILLMNQSRAKITDLGVSKLGEAQQFMTQCPGAPVYMPPEALTQMANYTEKLDCFSFGVLLIQIGSCRFPRPEPHEVLVNDSTSPTGFVKMPVREIDRRAKDLVLIDTTHPLRQLMLDCIADMPCNRPDSSQLCEQLGKLKLIPEYATSKSKKGTTSLPSQSSIPATPINNKETEKEIKSLKDEIESCREILKMRDEELAKKSKEITSLDTSQKEIELLEEKLGEMRLHLQEKDMQLERERERCTVIEEQLRIGKEQERQRQGSSFIGEIDHSSKVIQGLDPNIVALLSKDKSGELSGVMYGTPKPGSITVTSKPTESLMSRIGLVLDTYRKLTYSSNLVVDFIVIPSSFPREEVCDKIELYNRKYLSCHLSYLENLQVIQIVSLQKTSIQQVKEHWEKEWTHTIFMSGKRRLCLKKTDILKENVTVIVSASNRRLNPNGGMSKAVNLASGGKMAQLCEEYIQKYGHLEECGIFKTQSAGDLKCQWVLHAAGPDGTKYSNKVLQDKMRELITKCLVQADKLSATSIAIPPIGTGHMHIDRKLAANSIIAAVMDYDYLNDATLREIIICVIDEQTFKDFAEVFADRRANLEYKQSSSGYLDDLLESSVNTNAPLAPTANSSCRTQ